MITKRRPLQSFIFALVLVASALAQQPSSNTASVNRLQQVIAYLASDALEGRRTGTSGANDAAHYIAGEFSLLGLRPGLQMARPARTRGENRAQFLQPFPYVANVELGKGNILSVSKNEPSFELRAGEDWTPLGFSSNGRVGPLSIVFAGYGITDPEQKYNDYPSTVKDKIAFILSGTPDGDNPHGRFARYEEVRWKAIAARNAGAKALMVISKEERFKDDRLTRLRYDNNGDAGLPVIVISRQSAMRIFGAKDSADLSRAEQASRALIADQLKKEASAYGNAALPSAEKGPVSSFTLTLTTDVVRRESPSFNVVGILPGSDPRLKGEAIVIGAHYDHLGMGGEGSGSLSASTGIHHGADDNASGVAGLIELARMLSSQNPKPRRTIVFIAFSGEEEGLIGSNYYVNHPVVPLANTVAMINMDMIGRMKDKNLIVGGVGTAQEWRSMIDADNNMQSMTVSLNGIRLDPNKTANSHPVVVGANGNPVVSSDPARKFFLTLNEDGYGPSDHSSFYAKQVPVLFFWTGTHNDYHKPSDTADKINYEGEAGVVSFIERIVRDIDKSDKRPTYTVAKSESRGRAMGFRVYLGTIPNYADSNDGLTLDGVREDSPASKAGLKAGDKIVKMGGREVKNVYDYTYALGEMKAGQEYEVEVVRGSEKLMLKITPTARK
jgi:aminopeptidase YwaD